MFKCIRIGVVLLRIIHSVWFNSCFDICALRFLNLDLRQREVLSVLIGASWFQIAQEVAKSARKLEFVGLGLSLVSLTFSIFIFSYFRYIFSFKTFKQTGIFVVVFRRLRVFRNMLHLQLMIAILMVVIIRLILYIDLIFTDRMNNISTVPEGKTIKHHGQLTAFSRKP